MWSDDDEYFSYSPYYFDSDVAEDDSDEDIIIDDDDYRGYSSGENYSVVMSRRARALTGCSDEVSTTEDIPAQTYQAPSLQDSCCRFIALNFPFAFVEHRSPPIADELQLKIIEFSFPEDKEMIRKYAEFSRSSVDFCSAKRLLDNGNVKDLNQIGFRLSASVEDRRYSSSRSSDSGKNYVTIHFDRGKITSAHCSCDLSTNWCVHVIATCLARIKDKNSITAHMPVSDSLNSLDREQLLKFAQYLLCEHQNEPVVETAQKLLDKLLSRHESDKQEDINRIAGAPDPSAGPGLDEEAHWFVCKNGFKSRCESLLYESHQDLGFVKYNDRDGDRVSAVNELWGRNSLQQALIRDEMDFQLDNDHCGYPDSSRRQSVLQVLQTIADLLKDDFMSAVSALKMCTEQLIERLQKLCHVNSPRDYYLHRMVGLERRENKEIITLYGSLAGGFTPRISGCRTLSDELSRLWRLAVLSPGISPKQRQVVVDQLRTLNETVSVVFVNGPLRPWHGLEVAVRLSSIDWSSHDLQQVFKGEWTCIPSVSSCMAIQLSCQSKDTYFQEWMEVDQCDSETRGGKARPDLVIPLSFHHPHCIALGPLSIIDIHSLCSMIEALNVGGNQQHAMRLTVAVSYALVSFYRSALFGKCDVTSMPVSARCVLGAALNKAETKMEDNKKSDSPMEVEICNEKPNTAHIWPEDTVLAISTFAFLFQLLSQKPDLVDTSIAELRCKLELQVPCVNALDFLKSAMSLRFQLGVVGLWLQRLPASSPHHEHPRLERVTKVWQDCNLLQDHSPKLKLPEAKKVFYCYRRADFPLPPQVDEYNCECWLTYQLICCSPAESDLTFVAHLGQQLPWRLATPSPMPPSSLCRVIFHHLFKGAPAALSKSLTDRQSIGLKAAFSALAYANEYTVKENSQSWMLFQYANCRLWAKLAEVVLRSLSDSSELLGEAMGCILKREGMLGAQFLEKISVDSAPSNFVSRLRDIEFVSGKSRVAYCLAKALSERHGNSIRMTQYKTESRYAQRESFDLDMPRKIMKSGVEEALKLCSVQIAAHSLWLKKLADKESARFDAARWLTDFVVSSGVDSLECLVNCRGDVSSFLDQAELLQLCEKILKKDPERQVKLIVQNVLLSLLQKASRAESCDDMKRIISFCREKRVATKRDLLPWICIGLQTLDDGKCFLPFDVVMDASHGMLEHYKDRLLTTEKEIHIEWTQKGVWCLNRLFSEGVTVEDESDNDESDSLLANKNPFRTRETHPFLETAFNLGMIGLERLKEKPDDLDHSWIPHYRVIRSSPVKEHLNEFCRLVCYLVNKKWLTEIKSPVRESRKPLITSSKPGCSHWEDSQTASASKVSCDSCYLQKFVYSLINNVDNPLWLFEVLQQLGEHLAPEVGRNSHASRHERQNIQIRQVCQCYPPVKLLLQKDLDAFSKLLLGPKLLTVVEEVTRKRDRRRLEPSQIAYELGHSKLINTRLQEVLQVAKRAFSISDSSGAMFKNLTDEIATEYPILQSLLNCILKDEELSTPGDREFIFPRGAILPALFAQGLFPGLFERSHIDEYF